MKNYDSELMEHLQSFTTENRKSRMMKVLEQRTRYITVVLEDIFQPHNASAVLRSCDGFGIQDVHIIENKNRFSPNKDVDMGTSQWLSINRNSPANSGSCTSECLERLKKDGYRIVATTPHTNDTDLEDFDLNTGKTAIVLGTELEGISREVEESADEFLKIPMHGFVESFNISVACALILHHLSWKLRSSDIGWQLSEEEKAEIQLEWLRKTVNNADSIETRFKSEYKSS
ncbi:MAG: RNA methyltransferase [Spirochaetales bacterium]|uniref:tRNA (guanosine(18)-2'-O)-methyltransferase n=1 Tax=Candidatus Thalassospirochaeta sargassi TaxID=3119039 RepID=A0AAJ1IEW2_9SPIO|nr:RNA methyltransferase [Spirochaetales bacterium]